MLARLTARDFRNLAPLVWEPGAGRQLLLGDNGAGKTSLLEAVYLLATTRSFRTSQLADCARHGSDGFRLDGEAEGIARWRLEVAWRRGGLDTPEAGEKSRAVNGRSTSLAEHLEALPVVAWEAAEAEVLTGAPALRRRLLDRGVVATRPGALTALARYRRALRQKRDLLAGPATSSEIPSQLASWNAVLAAAAAEVARLRAAYAERLTVRLAEVLAESGLGFPEIGLLYRPSPPDALAGEAAIGERLARAAPGERRRGLPLIGPHRDELEMLWGGHPVRATVSAGERKALSLLVTAAHGRVIAAAEREPVYLLDDLDAELAPTTLARVWEVFAGARQLFATSNRPRVWEGLATSRRWSLDRGRVEPS